MESRRQVRLVSLDLLRTIAIVLLVTGHIALAVGSPIGEAFGIPGFYMVGLGDVAVILFLVLSGLALELNYGQKHVHFSRFMVGRILRIYPVYWLILPIGILIYVLTSCQGASTASCLSSRGSDLLCSVFGTCAFIGRWGGPFVATGWFIGLIMCMYVLYPYLSISFRHHRHLTLLVVFLVSVCSRVILQHYDILSYAPTRWFPLCRLIEFGLGIYLANIIGRDLWARANRLRKLAPILAFIGDLSFPLFLVHYPLLVIIVKHNQLGMSESTSIVLFLCASVLTSWLIHIIADRLIPREVILKRLFKDPV